MAMARLSKNKDYGSDNKVGDRTLMLFLGKGFY